MDTQGYQAMADECFDLSEHYEDDRELLDPKTKNQYMGGGDSDGGKHITGDEMTGLQHKV